MKYLDLFKLEGKVILVAGGSGLIGSEVCAALSSAGAKVVSLDIKKSNITDKLVTEEHFDISNLDQIESSLTQLENKFGPIHGLVNCSYPRTEDWPECTFTTTKLQSLNSNISSHLNGSMWAANVIAKSMRKNKIEGSIVNFGSIYGVVGQDMSIYRETEIELNMVYSSIKAGLNGYTKQMASFYGQFGIRVNCLCPGGIFDNQNETFVKNYSQKVPLRRMGTPQDIASSVIFLLSDASKYLTGTTFMVDGGWTAI